jgi:predicted AAA+ superfamily ATPase
MRYLTPFVESDLKKKMVFMGGPRQCGKTTLAKQLLESHGSGLYLNWDRSQDRKRILNETWDHEDDWIVLDEVHKYPKWKNLVKGFYDALHGRHHFLITGSARLDVYRKGGDSLLGRYHHWRLHPFTLDEIPLLTKITQDEAFRRLMTVGGFPEPFLANDEREARRWQEERHERILRDDIRDLENVRNIQQLTVLLDLLRERVGGLISLSNLASDLQVSPITVSRWIEIFERMYLIFIVRPYTKNLPRSLQKPFKVYFFDNNDVQGDEGPRFENLVAMHLLKRCHFLQDYSGKKWALGYLRNKEKQEVDFIVTCDGKIEELIEAKWDDDTISPSLLYFGQKLNAPVLTQIVGNLKKSVTRKDVRIMGPTHYFQPTQAGAPPSWFLKK